MLSERVPIKAVTNAIAVIRLLLILEIFSIRIVTRYNRYYVQSAVEVEIGAMNDNIASQNFDDEQYAVDQVAYQAMDASPYRYAAFTTFENRPCTSQAINVNSDGSRATVGETEEKSEATLWFSGASPIFGATNQDAWTIPFRVREKLAQEGTRFRIRKFGVVGYTTWQAYFLLRKQLLLQECQSARKRDPVSACKKDPSLGLQSVRVVARSRRRSVTKRMDTPLPACNAYYNTFLILPFYPGIADGDVDHVVNVLKDGLSA